MQIEAKELKAEGEEDMLWTEEEVQTIELEIETVEGKGNDF